MTILMIIIVMLFNNNNLQKKEVWIWYYYNILYLICYLQQEIMPCVSFNKKWCNEKTKF